MKQKSNDGKHQYLDTDGNHLKFLQSLSYDRLRFPTAVLKAGCYDNGHESIASPRMMKDNSVAVYSCQKSFNFLEL